MLESVMIIRLATGAMVEVVVPFGFSKDSIYSITVALTQAHKNTIRTYSKVKYCGIDLSTVLLVGYNYSIRYEL